MENFEANYQAFLADLRSGSATTAVTHFPEDAEPDDALEKFIREDQLRAAGATGRAAVDPDVRLRSETQPDQDEDVDVLLQKNAGGRRRQAIGRWLREQVALGKSTDELIAHARMHDLATGNLLAEVAAEI